MSVVLLILAVILTFPSNDQPALDELGSPGVLQLVWLMARDPKTPKTLRDKVNKEAPDSLDLLEAGRQVKFLPRRAFEDSDDYETADKVRPEAQICPGHDRGSSGQSSDRKVSYAETTGTPSVNELAS